MKKKIEQSKDDADKKLELEEEMEEFKREREELIEEEKRIEKEFQSFTEEVDEEISKQYEQLTELTPGTEGYQEVISKIERLKVEQASIIAKKLVEDNNYLQSQGNNFARMYQHKLDEAIEILKQNIERTKATKDYAKYQDRLGKLQNQSLELFEAINGEE